MKTILLFLILLAGTAWGQIVTPTNPLANDYKVNCRVATTGNVADLVGTANDLEVGDTIDGVTLAANDRVLLKNQTSAAENGIWVVVGESLAPRRATDSDAWLEMPGSTVGVLEGTQGQSLYFNISAATGTVGTTNIYYSIIPGISYLDDNFVNHPPGAIEGDLLTFDGADWSVIPAEAAGKVLTSTGIAASAQWVSPGDFASHRAARHGSIPFPPFLAGTNGGAGSSYGTTTANYYPFVAVQAANVGTARTDCGTNAVGSPFGGTGQFVSGNATANFDVKWVFEFSAAASLSAHTDSRLSMHLQHTAAPTADRATNLEGVSIYWRGGGAAGTLELATSDGTTSSTTVSATTLTLGDNAVHRYWLEWEPGVGFRLYRNGTLYITKTTHRPAGDSATANSQGTYIYATNSASGITHNTGFRLYGASVTFLP